MSVQLSSIHDAWLSCDLALAKTVLIRGNHAWSISPYTDFFSLRDDRQSSKRKAVL